MDTFHHFFCRSWISLLVYCVIVPSGLRADVNSAVDAAVQRQNTVKTIDLRLHIKQFVAKGSVSEGSPIPVKILVPSADATLESDNLIIIDDRNIRVEYRHPLWQVQTGELIHFTNIATFNGSKNMQYYPEGTGPQRVRLAVFESGVSISTLRINIFSPLTLHLRGNDSSVAPDVLQSVKRTGTASIGTQMFDLYTKKSPENRLIEVYVDPQKNHSITRIRRSTLGKTTIQCDITYSRDSTIGWMPTNWTVNRYDQSDNLIDSSQVTITQYTINQTIRNVEFESTLPPGTRVEDRRINTSFIVDNAGNWELFPVDTPNQDEPQIIKSETNWYIRNVWMFVLLGVLMIAGLAIWYARSRVQKS